jgi:glycosyltransferase involved in cell wall biosynthesis
MFVVTDNVWGFSGYAKAVRELVYAMSKQTYVRIIAQGSGYLPERVWPLITNNLSINDDDYIFGRPYFSNPFQIPKGKIIANISLESTTLPERMVKQCNNDRVKQVWFPSKHVYNSGIRSGIIEDKIRVIPHGYDPEIFKMENRKENEKFRFLFVGGYTGRGDRKGLDLLWQAFSEEFNKDDNVQLDIKVNKAYDPNFDALKDLMKMSKIKPLAYNDMEYTDRDMVHLYNQADCFVCPSYGEGFNMTVLEALACGLPVITSSWGGQMDYCREFENRVELIDIEGIVPAKYSPWDTGYWMKPSLASLKEIMREVYESRPKREVPKGISKWSWDEAAKKAVKCIT